MIKKIETQEDRDRKTRRVKIIVSVVMAVLIGLSSLGYAIMSKSNSGSSTSVVNYAGLKFVKSNGLWTTSINNKIFYFNYLPTELANITVSGNYSLDGYYQKTAYIINANPATNNLLYALNGIASRTQEACMQGISCANKDLPIKNCTENLFVFYSSNSNITSIYREDNCVFISGNFFEGVDKLLYRLLNIN